MYKKLLHDNITNFKKGEDDKVYKTQNFNEYMIDKIREHTIWPNITIENKKNTYRNPRHKLIYRVNI